MADKKIEATEPNATESAVIELTADIRDIGEQISDTAKKLENTATKEDFSALQEKLSEQDNRINSVLTDFSQGIVNGKAEYKDPYAGNTGFSRFLHNVYTAHRKSNSYVDESLKSHQERMAAEGKTKWASGVANEAIDAEGGYLVPTQTFNEIVQPAVEGSQIISRVRQIPVQTNSIKLNRKDVTTLASGGITGGTVAYWTGEQGAITPSQPAFGTFRLELNKLAALVAVTSELLDDSPVSMGAILREDFINAIQWKIEDAILNGDGVGKPTGLLSSNAVVSVAKESNQTATTINTQNVLKMWSRCYATNRQNAVWLVNQDCEPQLYALSLAVGTAGGSLVNLFNIANGPQGSLLGRPVIMSQHCQTLGTVGDIWLVDLSQYYMIMKGEQFAESMHLYFDTDKMAYRVTTRTDGASVWANSLTAAKGSNTLSPFVNLATRA